LLIEVHFDEFPKARRVVVLPGLSITEALQQRICGQYFVEEGAGTVIPLHPFLLEGRHFSDVVQEDFHGLRFA
jgi:hypothetical protein